MKEILMLLLLFLYTPWLLAQVPQKMSYQAIVRNAGGELVKDSTISIRITILNGWESEAAVYAETHLQKTNENGLLVLEIGQGNSEIGNFSQIDWSNGEYFLKTEIDLAGGINYTISGTSQLLSVPYAFYAARAEGAATVADLESVQNSMSEKLENLQNSMTEDVDKLEQSMLADVHKLQQRVVNMEGLFYSQLPIPSGDLKVFYPFKGNANDFSGNGWDGTVNNGELTTDRFGNTDNAYYFAGTANVAAQFAGVSGDGDRSVSFWAKINSNETGGSCCYYGSSDNGKSFSISVNAQPAPSVRLDIGNAYIDYPAKNADDGEWHHFVVVYSNKTGTSLNGVKAFFDGELLTDYTSENFTTYSLNTGTDIKFTMGGKSGVDTRISLDDLRFYNRVLTDSEILQLFYESGAYNGQQVISDSDGNSYPVVKIGNQIWMAENLRTTRYNDGAPIPYVTDVTEWINLESAAYCWQNNDIGNKLVYGALYTWYTVKSDKLCPSGWHVPTDAEWTILENNLGGMAVAGGKMKETGTVHWLDPNTDATNESGLTVLPGGWRDGNNASFTIIGVAGMWWTSQETIPDRPYWREIYNSSGTIYHLYGGDPSYGLSVRCLKDQ